jgi:3-isopropylmalate/(R)-2-methylmalate dehydratase large subunit
MPCACLPNGQTQLYVGLHLVHEVTSPQAFAELDSARVAVRAPERTFARRSHRADARAGAAVRDLMAESMTSVLERNCREHGIPLFDLASGTQGIVHVIGPSWD